MNITFTGNKTAVSQALRDFTQEKFGRLLRRFDKIISINVTFAVERLQNIAEATIHLPGTEVHASSESSVDMYSAVDTLIDKLDRLVKKHKDKTVSHRD